MGSAAKVRLALYLPLLVIGAVVLLLRNDLTAGSAETSDPPPPPAPTLVAEAGPRMVTLDGRRFDFGATGDFVLLQADPIEMEVHGRIRQSRAGDPLVDRVAVVVNYHWVQLRADGRLLIDSAPFHLKPDYRVDLRGRAFVTRFGDVYTVDAPGRGARAQVRMEGHGVRVRLPRGVEAAGLLAEGSGDPERFRVAEDESLFRNAR